MGLYDPLGLYKMVLHNPLGVPHVFGEGTLPNLPQHVRFVATRPNGVAVGATSAHPKCGL